MSNYTKQISWSGKDALSDSDTEKVISGGDFDTEFSAVQTAINSKIDDIVDDTTPQLGGDLDFQTHKATSFTSTGIDDNATSTAITIDASENVEINTGNLVIGTSGKGIDFSADGNAAGMTSEVLDDYETGTFTPTLTFGGASVGITYNTTKTYGWYTKIGNVVNIQLYIYLSAKGTSTGDAVIGGLPVASAAGSDKYTPMSFLGNRVSLANNHASFIGNSATTIALRETSLAGTLTTLTSGNFVDNSAFMVNITYRTD